MIDPAGTATIATDHPRRLLLPWIAATVVATALLTGLLPRLAGAPVQLTEGARFADLLVTLAAAVLAGCTVWTWLALTLDCLALSRGADRVTGCPRWLHRALVVCCGATLAGGLLAPAYAEPAEDARGTVGVSVLDGLPLPDRPALPPRRPSDASVVVEPGDSLWLLARQTLPTVTTDAAITRRWHRIHARNRAVIGPDPDLIHPGQVLHLTESRKD